MVIFGLAGDYRANNTNIGVILFGFGDSSLSVLNFFSARMQIILDLFVLADDYQPDYTKVGIITLAFGDTTLSVVVFLSLRAKRGNLELFIAFILAIASFLTVMTKE
jgi:hypothetical protein